MPINDKGTAFPSDIGDVTPTPHPTSGELNYLIDQFKSPRTRQTPGLVPEKEIPHEFFDIRNAYEGLIVEELEDNVYMVSRQDKKIGPARSYIKKNKYRIGQTVTIVRPQEEETSNPWYIISPPEINRHHLYGASVTGFNNNRLKFTGPNIGGGRSSITKVEEFNERFAIQDTDLEAKIGGIYLLSLNGLMTGFPEQKTPSEGRIYYAYQKIPKATSIGGGWIKFGQAHCSRVFIDWDNGTFRIDNGGDVVYNMVFEDIKYPRFIQTKTIEGRPVIDVEPCTTP